MMTLYIPLGENVVSNVDPFALVMHTHILDLTGLFLTLIGWIYGITSVIALSLKFFLILVFLLLVITPTLLMLHLPASTIPRRW